MHSPENTLKAFEKQFGEKPTFVVRAPGRVNLIGEHTDYNDGFVFPIAIDKEMLIAGCSNSGDGDDTVSVYSLDMSDTEVFSLKQIQKNDDERKRWCNYFKGVLQILQDDGYQLKGFKAALSGNVPQGAGLSSSAAYGVAVATLMSEMFNLKISKKDIALLAQKAENKFVGMQCGIMDQFISSLGETDSALLIDCRTLDFSSIPLSFADQGLTIVITNSGVQRGLVDSEYNTRRKECTKGSEMIQEKLGKPVKNLRDVSLTEFESVAEQLPLTVKMRCRHVISENERVLATVDALKEKDYKAVGKLMNESHYSLRDDFQVSCPEVDRLVELTAAHPGVLGARMTGAGFGGCTVAIMDSAAVESFTQNVISIYEKQSGKKAEVYICESVAGAGKLDLVSLAS